MLRLTGLVLVFLVGAVGQADAQLISVATFAELEAAVDSAGPGTEIVLSDGVYEMVGARMHTRRGGTAAQPVTVRARRRHGAILRTNGSESAFQIEQPYWAFDGLHIRVTGGSAHAYKLEQNGHHAVIMNGKIEMDSPAEGGIKGAGGPSAPQPDDALIEGNEIWMNAPTHNSNSQGIDAVGVARWIIRNNHIHHIQKDSVNFDGIGWGVFTKGNSIDTVIENNVVHDCFVGISLGGGGTGAQFFRDGDTRYEERNGIIRNNFILDSGDVAIYLNKAQNARIYHNTTFNSFTTCADGCSAIDVRFSGSTADIRNNILDKPILNRDGGQHTAVSNLVLPRPTHAAWFVDAAGYNLRLVIGAPALDRGQALAGALLDIDGTLRPQGLGVDIGAHELLSPSAADAGAEDSTLQNDAEPAADRSGPSASDAAYEDAAHRDGATTRTTGPLSGGVRSSARDCDCAISREQGAQWVAPVLIASVFAARRSRRRCRLRY